MKRKQRPPSARLRKIDKPLLTSYGPRSRANRDFVTARVARNRRRFRRILAALTVLMAAGAAFAWWHLWR